MYKVKISMEWHEEAKARIWCSEQDILFRLEDSQDSYEKTKEKDKILPELMESFTIKGPPIDRVFCFKHIEDAMAFKIVWSDSVYVYEG